MDDLYEQQLQDLYSAEEQITEALPKMIKAAQSPQLKKAFEKHLKETEHQLNKLETVFKDLEVKPGKEKCKAMEGIMKEGEHLLKTKANPQVLDAALIATAQRVEHYEIAGYGTARRYAQMLGYERQAKILEEILNEEKQADILLTELAESSINQRALV